MARSVFLLVPLLLVGCVSSRSTALRIDAPPLEAEVWLAIGQSNMEVFADKVPRGADHVEVQQFGHDPQFNIPLWTSLKRAGKFSAVAGEFAATLSRLRRRPVRVIAAAVGGTDLSCWERGGDCYDESIGTVTRRERPNCWGHLVAGRDRGDHPGSGRHRDLRDASEMLFSIAAIGLPRSGNAGCAGGFATLLRGEVRGGIARQL